MRAGSSLVLATPFVVSASTARALPLSISGYTAEDVEGKILPLIGRITASGGQPG